MPHSICARSRLARLQVLKGSKSISGSHAKIVIHPKTKAVGVCAALWGAGAASPPSFEFSPCLIVAPQQAQLLDLNSLNGCFVNEVRVVGGSQNIASGDVIRFGYDSTAYKSVRE